jgi:MFS family permease
MQNLGERILFSFTALFAETKGATPSEQGILLSLRNILSFITQQFFGKASDRYGRSLILGIGFLLSVISSFLMSFALTPVSIIILFALYSVGFSAIKPAWDALIGDTYAAEERSRMLGHIGSIASLIGGLMFLGVGLYSDTVSNSYKILFSMATIAFTFAFISVVLLSVTSKFPQRAKFESNGLSLFEPLQNRRFRRFALIDAVYNFAMSTTWPLFPHVEAELATTGQITIIWFAGFIGFSITAKNASKIQNYIGSYNKSFYVSRGVLWTVPIFYAFATSWYHLLITRVLAVTSFGFYTILQKDYILETTSQLNRPQDRGWFLGTHAFMFGIFTFVGSLSSGYISEYVLSNSIAGYKELFLVTSVLRFIACLGFFFVLAPKANDLLKDT